MLDRDAILAAQDLETAVVDVPEWGGQVTVKTLTAAKVDGIDAEMMEARNKGQVFQYRLRYVAASLVNEQGGPLFVTGVDMIELGKKSAAAIDRIFTVVARLNKLGTAGIESAEKN